MSTKKIIFIYNADHGKINAAIDSLHKILSPSTDQCALCAITHNLFGLKSDWQTFLTNLETKTEFLHRDQLDNQLAGYLTEAELPLIAIQEADEEIRILFSSDQLSTMQNDPELLKAALLAALSPDSLSTEPESDSAEPDSTPE